MNLLVLLKTPTGDGLMTWNEYRQEMIVVKSCSKSVSGEKKVDVKVVGVIEGDVTRFRKLAFSAKKEKANLSHLTRIRTYIFMAIFEAIL